MDKNNKITSAVTSILEGADIRKTIAEVDFSKGEEIFSNLLTRDSGKLKLKGVPFDRFLFALFSQCETSEEVSYLKKQIIMRTNTEADDRLSNIK